jgi:anti-sigma factor RsiW
MLHPSFRTLGDFVDGALDAARSRRIARHLERCAACCDAVWSIRAIDAAAREIPVAAMPGDLLARTLQRRAAGEAVLVPAVDDVSSPVRSRPRWHGVIAAAAAVVLLVVTIPWQGPEVLEAETSELRFSPAAPHPGGRLAVSYRASARLGAAQTLVLRARLRRPGDASVHEQVEVARLRRAGDRTFAGSLTLPDSAVYAVFAVENTAADRVDAGYERWEVLLHGADGRPLFDALHQQYQDLRMRDSERAQRVAAEIAKLYPHAPRGGSPATPRRRGTGRARRATASRRGSGRSCGCAFPTWTAPV